MRKISTPLLTLLFFIFNFSVLAQPTQKTKRKPIAKHVILIGLDGWGAYSLPKADMPNIKNLMANGSYTLKKRSVLPSSSAVNWGSMFMGAGPEIHGYTQWDSRVPELPSRVVYKNNIFPTVFQLLRDADPKAEMGVVYDWEGIKYLVDTLSLNYHEQSFNPEKNPNAVTVLAENYIKTKKPTLMGVFFDHADHVGHEIGHNTPEYYDILKVVDGYIGSVIQATKDAGIYENTIFIVSSDHGGINKGHGGKTMEEMESPFIISGKNVKNLGSFEDSMMQYDIASTIAYILDLNQPQVWIGRPIKKVFK